MRLKDLYLKYIASHPSVDSIHISDMKPEPDEVIKVPFLSEFDYSWYRIDRPQDCNDP